MTDHRTTEQIIDAIDHCLDDFTVSGDAMRWSPNTDEDAPLAAFPRHGLFQWIAADDEPSDAAEPESIQHHHEHVHLPVSIGFDGAGRGVHIVPVVGRGWGRQAALDRAAADRQVRAQTAELAEAVGVAVGPFIEFAERAAAEMGMQLAEWQRHVVALVATMRPAIRADLTGLSVDPPDDGEEPRERALRLRQQRNTGPTRDRTRQRRPRTHQ